MLCCFKILTSYFICLYAFVCVSILCLCAHGVCVCVWGGGGVVVVVGGGGGRGKGGMIDKTTNTNRLFMGEHKKLYLALEVDTREKVQIFLYFTIFCYVLSMYLYICIHTPPLTIGSINNSHRITFSGMSNINDKNMVPYKLLKSKHKPLNYRSIEHQLT